jgi:hypothetical protein
VAPPRWRGSAVRSRSGTMIAWPRPVPAPITALGPQGSRSPSCRGSSWCGGSRSRPSARAWKSLSRATWGTASSRRSSAASMSHGRLVIWERSPTTGPATPKAAPSRWSGGRAEEAADEGEQIGRVRAGVTGRAALTKRATMGALIFIKSELGLGSTDVSGEIGRHALPGRPILCAGQISRGRGGRSARCAALMDRRARCASAVRPFNERLIAGECDSRVCAVVRSG